MEKGADISKQHHKTDSSPFEGAIKKRLPKVGTGYYTCAEYSCINVRSQDVNPSLHRYSFDASTTDSF